MVHLYFSSFNLPFVRLWTETEDGRLVAFWHWILQVGNETSCLLGVIVNELSQGVELVFCCDVQLHHTMSQETS